MQAFFQSFTRYSHFQTSWLQLAMEYWKGVFKDKEAKEHKEILRKLRSFGLQRKPKDDDEIGKILHEAIKEHLKDKKGLE